MLQLSGKATASSSKWVPPTSGSVNSRGDATAEEKAGDVALAKLTKVTHAWPSVPTGTLNPAWAVCALCGTAPSEVTCKVS